MQNVSNSRPNKLKGRKSYKASAFSLLLNSHAVEKANRLKTIAAFTQRRQVHLHGESIGDCWGQIFAADRDPRLRLSLHRFSLCHIVSLPFLLVPLASAQEPAQQLAMAGIIIATASYDRSIRFWDAASTRCTRMIAPPKEAKNESVRHSSLIFHLV